MAEYIIDKIAYDGNVYKLQDNQSGYITTETDPVFSASAAAGISATDISNWNGNLSASNWLNGSATGSVRTSGSKAEDSSYTIGLYSTAEGYNTQVSGNYAHAEGGHTIASGIYSHAEGVHTEASGNYSNVSGFYTVAQRKSQHVFGEYNILDTTGTDGSTKGSYIEIVGKGKSESERSNARTLDWMGNEVIAGKLTLGAGPTVNMDAATKQYVDNAIPTKTSDLTNDGDSDGHPFVSLNDVIAEGYITADYLATPTFRAADATSKAVLLQAFGVDANIMTPSSYTSQLLLLLDLEPRTWFCWMNGTEMELARLSVSANTGTSTITLYLRGRTSIATGIMGVDSSWTVTPLASDAEGVAY